MTLTDDVTGAPTQRPRRRPTGGLAPTPAPTPNPAPTSGPTPVPTPVPTARPGAARPLRVLQIPGPEPLEPPTPVRPPTPEPRRPALPDRMRAALRHERSTMAALPRSPLPLALLVLAGLSAWFVLFAVWGSALEEHHAQHNLYGRIRSELANETAPPLSTAANPAAARLAPEGAPVAVLSIPALGITRSVVVEGTSSKDLRSGPGLLLDSPLPGEFGVSEIYGRALTFGGPFGDLGHLRPGDAISVITGQGASRYTVSTAVSSTLAVHPMSDGASLVLVSAQGGGWRSGWAPDHAVYVTATLTSKPFARPSNAAYAVTTGNPMATDRSGLTTLVFWLEALLIAVVATVLIGLRLGLRRSWPIAVPVCLAALWGASASVLLLLPNLF